MLSNWRLDVRSAPRGTAALLVLLVAACADITGLSAFRDEPCPDGACADAGTSPAPPRPAPTFDPDASGAVDAPGAAPGAVDASIAKGLCGDADACGLDETCEHSAPDASLACVPHDLALETATLFRAVFGREPQSPSELAPYEQAFHQELTSPAATIDEARRAVTQRLERDAEARELDAIIARAIQAMATKITPDVDAEGHPLAQYLKDKVTGQFGERLPASYTEIGRFLDARAQALIAATHTLLWEVYGSLASNIAGASPETAFDRALMESPADPAARAAVRTRWGLALVSNATDYNRVILRAIGDGKQDNPATPNLDGAVAFTEDRDFFRGDISASNGKALSDGIFGWIYGRVKDSHAPSREALRSSFAFVLGCDKATSPTPCPSPHALAYFTANFYGSGHGTDDFGARNLNRKIEAYASACASAGDATPDCSDEIRSCAARACVFDAKGCEHDASAQNDVVDEVARGALPANWGCIECYVRSDRTLPLDPQCCYSFRDTDPPGERRVGTPAR